MEIYKITNKINNKVYIGKTESSINRRYYIHLRCARNKINSPLYDAMNKYGYDNFTIEELEKCKSREKLNEREIYWIKYYNSTNRSIGYNLSNGGTGGAIWFGPHSEESKNKMRKPKVPFSEEARKNMSLAHLGVPLSEKHKNGMKLSAKRGEDNPAKRPENREKDRIAHLGNTNVRGRIWVKNIDFNVSRMIEKDKLKHYLSVGWLLGRLKFKTESNYGV